MKVMVQTNLDGCTNAYMNAHACTNAGMNAHALECHCEGYVSHTTSWLKKNQKNSRLIMIGTIWNNKIFLAKMERFFFKNEDDILEIVEEKKCWFLTLSHFLRLIQINIDIIKKFEQQQFIGIKTFQSIIDYF